MRALQQTGIIPAREKMELGGISGESWTAAACCRFGFRSPLRSAIEERMKSLWVDLRMDLWLGHLLPGQQAGSGRAAAGSAYYLQVS
jgi:hypothetical protein